MRRCYLPLIAALCTFTSQLTFASPDPLEQLARCEPSTREQVALVVNVDDLGVHPDMDRAGLALLKSGHAQTGSVMVNAPNFDALLPQLLALDIPVGVHLNLTNEWQAAIPWGGVLGRAKTPSLYNAEGRFWASGQEVAANAKLAEVEAELLAQVRKAEQSGLKISHIDAHMLIPFWSQELFNLIHELPGKTGYPVIAQMSGLDFPDQLDISRALQNGTGAGMVPIGMFGIPLTQHDTYTMHWNPEVRQIDQPYTGYRELIGQWPAGINHLAIHPAYASDALAQALNDLPLRTSDRLALEDPAFDQARRAAGVVRARYAALNRPLSGGCVEVLAD